MKAQGPVAGVGRIHEDPWMRRLRFGWRRMCLVGSLLLLAGCRAEMIQGKVLDIAGSPLPGVVVSIEGMRHQDLTDPRGDYEIKYKPGRLVLHYYKTGYTPGRLELDVDAPRAVQAVPVRLWCLPENKGVYLFEDFRYRATRPIECEELVTKESGTIYGTSKYRRERADSVSTANPEPVLLCYSVPRHQAELSRLRETELVLAGSQAEGAPIRAWVPDDGVPLTLAAIDEPEGLLQQVCLPGPLEPGVYAIHWGALEGMVEFESRMFVFAIEGEEQTEEEEAAAEPGDLKPEPPQKKALEKQSTAPKPAPPAPPAPAPAPPKEVKPAEEKPASAELDEDLLAPL